jgi:hypothetical protein
MANTNTVVVENESSENVVEVSPVVDAPLMPVKKSKGGKAKAQTQVTPSVASAPSTSSSCSDVPTSSSVDELETLKKAVEALTKRVEDLEASQDTKPVATTASKSVKKDKEEKKQRAPTAYNIFMKTKMVELKETHPQLNNIERMKMAAEAWSESKK